MRLLRRLNRKNSIKWKEWLPYSFITLLCLCPGTILPVIQFFLIVYTHFLKACLILSELYTQIKKHTHNGQNPSILLQNETLHSKQCYFSSKWYFVFKWQTQTIIWIDIYKNQLNSDVLNLQFLPNAYTHVADFGSLCHNLTHRSSKTQHM